MLVVPLSVCFRAFGGHHLRQNVRESGLRARHAGWGSPRPAPHGAASGQ